MNLISESRRSKANDFNKVAVINTKILLDLIRNYENQNMVMYDLYFVYQKENYTISCDYNSEGHILLLKKDLNTREWNDTSYSREYFEKNIYNLFPDNNPIILLYESFFIMGNRDIEDPSSSFETFAVTSNPYLTNFIDRDNELYKQNRDDKIVFSIHKKNRFLSPFIWLFLVFLPAFIVNQMEPDYYILFFWIIFYVILALIYVCKKKNDDENSFVRITENEIFIKSSFRKKSFTFSDIKYISYISFFKKYITINFFHGKKVNIDFFDEKDDLCYFIMLAQKHGVEIINFDIQKVMQY